MTWRLNGSFFNIRCHRLGSPEIFPLGVNRAKTFQESSEVRNFMIGWRYVRGGQGARRSTVVMPRRRLFNKFSETRVYL